MWFMLIPLLLGLIFFIFKYAYKINQDMKKLNLGTLLCCLFLGSLIVAPLIIFANGRFWWYALAAVNTIAFFALGWYGRKGDEEWRNRQNTQSNMTQKKIRRAWAILFVINIMVVFPLFMMVVLPVKLPSIMQNLLSLILIYNPNVDMEYFQNAIENPDFTFIENLVEETGLTLSQISAISQVVTWLFLLFTVAPIILFIIELRYEKKNVAINLDTQSTQYQDLAKSYISMFFVIGLNSFALLFVRGRELYEAFFNSDELSIRVFVIIVLVIILWSVFCIFNNIRKLIQR